ncbi:MAG: hypothetical protein IPK19_21510 [Chloroflexi bacterium]|nr:hypothetical protein [Chloroflexota bacterium]
MNTLEDRVAEFWAWRMKVPVETILAPGTHLIAGNADFPPPNRLVLYRSEWNTLIQLPLALQPQIETAPLLGSSDHAVTVDEAVAQIQAVLPALGASFAWRDYYYYQLPERITPRRRPGVRLLTPDSAADAAALECCPRRSDWERALSQISMEDALVAGLLRRATGW